MVVFYNLKYSLYDKTKPSKGKSYFLIESLSIYFEISKGNS